MHARPINRFLAGFFGLLLLSSSAYAQEPEAKTSAENWYQVALEHMEKGKYVTAGVAFEQAYILDANPTLLYNAARAYEKGRKIKRAKRLYQRYSIQDGVEKERRQKALGRIKAIDRELVSRLKDKLKDKPPPNGPDISATDGEASLGSWAWVSVGTGIVLGISAGVLRSIAVGDRASLQEKMQIAPPGVTSGVSQFDAYDVEASANRLDTAALVSGIVGGALLATGIVMLFLPQSETTIGVSPLGSGWIVGAEGRF